MKQLYKSIQSLFKSPETLQLFQQLNFCPPEFIDLYNGQPESPDDFEFTTPALFIDYSISWDKAGTMRPGTLTLEVHILTDPTPETDNLTAPLSGLEKVDYYETISDLLEGLSTSETSALVLTSERPVTTDYFNYHAITFTCTISRRRTQVTGITIGDVRLQPDTRDSIETQLSRMSSEKKYIID